MPDLAVLVPVLSGPEKIGRLLESAEATVPDANVLFLASHFVCHDEVAELDRLGCNYVVVDWACQPGDYARKINLGVQLTTEEFVFLGADDLVFRESFWFENALSLMCGQIKVVAPLVSDNIKFSSRTGYSSIRSGYCLVERSYVELGVVDEPGKLLHEGYYHEFVGDEFMRTAESRGAFDLCYFSHVWHVSDKERVYDDSGAQLDAELFLKRCRLWAESRSKDS